MAAKGTYIRKSAPPKVSINPDAQIKPIEAKGDVKYKCTCCGKEYSKQAGNFPTSNSVLFAGNGGYLSICKSCIDNFYRQLIKYYSGNEEQAIEHCCWTFDWYYDKDLVEMMRKSSKETSRVLTYPSKMNMTQIKDKGTTYLDTIKQRYTNRVTTVNTFNTQNGVQDEELQVPEGAVKMFGVGFTPSEYQYLIDEYNSWTTRHECKTKSQEEIFKNICRAQVVVQRAQQSGNTKEIADASKMLQDLMQSAGVKPTQNNDNVLADQNTFGTLIKKWETEKPISEPATEWQDVDGIKKYLDTYFLGHFCELLHIENDSSRAYREEMQKHTVTAPVYETDDDTNEPSILDKYSTRKKRDE